MKDDKKQNTNYNYWHKKAYQLNLEASLQKTKALHGLLIKGLGLSERDKGKKLLDVACGKGVFLRELQDRGLGLNLYGLDIADVAIKEAKEFVRAELTVGDAQSLPHEDNYFDYVSCLGGLEYYPSPKEGAQEMARVLKKHGLACVYVPNLMFIGHIYMAWRYGVMPSEGAKSAKGNFYDYKIEKFYTFCGWKDILENAGFKVIGCQKYNNISASKKVSSITKFLFNKFFQYFVPLNLSYCFIFVCQKK